ncbi:protein SODIUM POTASSIUM ROOT DEFECTIVE 2-like [Ananas comosus]|uniref:Protein SODIUM POTASSIUM ROOT DEFECTIVE 2-like n=1 Tax=Ananas comosus TaxID=4615 RepID=A0A6P5FY60_ANACO|nr:protein SODIUM POTASSIUM ROOT DEFECTIVE 2-like [Ananas comosus]
MAPLLFKDMKSMNFSCASPASAAVCTSIDRRSIVQPTNGRALDRHTPHVKDPRRRARPTAHTNNTTTTGAQPSAKQKYNNKAKHRKSLEKTDDLTSPPGSSRYLLDETEVFFDVFPGSESAPYSKNIELASVEKCKGDDDDMITAPRPSVSVNKPQDQVVVLRVSLHCKGCEAKLRKHLSKMEGVKSFHIDFATKKVTVIGDVTPLSVLNSITKVKNAQFWPSPPPLGSSEAI